MRMRTIINWKLYAVLLAAGILSVVAVLPYAFAAQAAVLKNVPLPLPVVAALSVAQSAVMFAVLVFFGLLLARRTGLGLPVLEHALAGGAPERTRRPWLKSAVLAGTGAGVLIIAGDRLFTVLGVNLLTAAAPPPWQGLLASLYGGIGEELLLRLFLMTFLAWIFSGFGAAPAVTGNRMVMWSAITVSTLVFGIGHLPMTAALTAITPLVILRALVLNGIGGFLFGWLYWKKGLESAMAAHFTADIVIHVLFVSLIRL